VQADKYVLIATSVKRSAAFCSYIGKRS